MLPLIIAGTAIVLGVTLINRKKEDDGKTSREVDESRVGGTGKRTAKKVSQRKPRKRKEAPLEREAVEEKPESGNEEGTPLNPSDGDGEIAEEGKHP